MELKKEQVDFIYLYKVVKISLDEVIFRKFNTKITNSLTSNDYVTVSLDKEIGDEIYHVTPEVNEVLIGRVGELIKGFKGKVYGSKRRTKRFVVNEIVELQNLTLNQFVK